MDFTKTFHHKPYDFISPERPELSVAGKNVVVTGSGSGIGRAIAIAFAQANAASVTLIGRRPDPLKETASLIAGSSPSTKVFPKSTDLTNRASLDAALDEVVQEVGKIDIFVSNAAAMPVLAPLAELEADHLRSAFEMNVISAFNAIQAFLQRAADGAKLLHVSGAGAHVGPIPTFMAAYPPLTMVAKMFQYVAAEHPEIHVVSVHPGLVDTQLLAKSGREPMDDAELPGRFMVWAASKEAEFLRGKYVWANWDAEELIAKKEEIVQPTKLTIHLDGVDL